MRRVLIVSPSFPPINAADLHRVRQSLPYMADHGWEVTVLTVDPDLVEGYRDPLLLETVPAGTDVRRVGAMDPRWTRKVGLGSLALRSLPFYRRIGNAVLAEARYDLIYFSTTMFPVLVLGPYWKRKWGIPYVIDMQDPWLTDYYLKRPKSERPPKFWFSHTLDRLMEPIAMGSVDGLISVSEAYCRDLRQRYPRLKNVPCEEIPFGGPEEDFCVFERIKDDLDNRFFDPSDGSIHVVYVGRGGLDMATSAHALFGALRLGLAEQPDFFDRVRMHFIGTNYAPEGRGVETILPVAEEYGLAGRVFEHPTRVSYFTVLKLLKDAAHLVIPGSAEAAYTASKLYPYILARRPLLAVFNENSSVVNILEKTRAGSVVTFATDTSPGDDALARRTYTAWRDLLSRLPFVPPTDWSAFEAYTARAMTGRQTALFDRVIEKDR